MFIVWVCAPQWVCLISCVHTGRSVTWYLCSLWTRAHFLLTWRNIVFFLFFATLSLSLKRYYRHPLYLLASFPSMGTCLAVRAPWLLSRGDAYNYSPSCFAKYLLNRPWTKCWSTSFTMLGYMHVVTLACCYIHKPLALINQTVYSVPLQLRWPIHNRIVFYAVFFCLHKTLQITSLVRVCICTDGDDQKWKELRHTV